VLQFLSPKAGHFTKLLSLVTLDIFYMTSLIFNICYITFMGSCVWKCEVTKTFLEHNFTELYIWSNLQFLRSHTSFICALYFK